MPEAVLNVLVGEGTGQTLEDVEVEFPAPAVDIEIPQKQVEVTRCEVIPGKVIVVGRVIKSTWFLRDGRGQGHFSVADDADAADGKYTHIVHIGTYCT
jgi:hypothetical protein